MALKIKAQEVLKLPSRKRIFDDRINSVKASYTEKVDFILGQAEEFIEEFINETESVFEYDLSASDVVGFETERDFYNGTGYIRLEAKLKTPSNQSLFYAMKVPLYKGELYKPSVILVNGKVKVFSAYTIMDSVEATNSHRVRVHDRYLPSQNFTHKDNVETPLFDPALDNHWNDLNMYDRYNY